MRWGGLQVTAVGKCALACIYTSHEWDWDMGQSAKWINYSNVHTIIIFPIFGPVLLSRAQSVISQAGVESPFIDRECISAKV